MIYEVTMTIKQSTAKKVIAQAKAGLGDSGRAQLLNSMRRKIFLKIITRK